jgi:2,4-dienoyl-CoA reductase-like NADH-dependent reductase (Old Yellow Enzyme family)
MSSLFEPVTIGNLQLRNRLMRSATAERMSDPETGSPLPRLGAMYAALAEGGVGLIVTGHAYVERGGKAHPEMSSIASDDVIPAWREVTRPAQDAGARVMMQINHCGASCDPTMTPHPVAPSGVATNELVAPGIMSREEIQRIIRAFGQAARRAREAGFDGVQIHGAHGYLVTQFLTPLTNRRDDGWGGDAERRRGFLKAVIREVRLQVGDDYPLWIKLGVAGKATSQLTSDEGARVANACARLGVDCVEISHALGTPEEIDVEHEARYRPMAEAVRQAVGNDFPLALVNGFRTRAGMEALLQDGLVQVISLSRPLIAEPDLPNKLRMVEAFEAACVRCGKCWPEGPGLGVACYHPQIGTPG